MGREGHGQRRAWAENGIGREGHGQRRAWAEKEQRINNTGWCRIIKRGKRMGKKRDKRSEHVRDLIEII